MLYDHRAFLKGLVNTGACSIWYCSISTRPHLPPEISLRLRTPRGWECYTVACLFIYVNLLYLSSTAVVKPVRGQPLV